MINEELNQDKKNYIKRPMMDINLWKQPVDTIAANKGLEKYLKWRPITMSELKNVSLLIKVISKEHSNKILQLKRLNNVKVIVQRHSTLNYTKETMKCRR